MSGALIVIWLLAAMFAVLAIFRADGSLVQGLAAAADQLVRVLPRVLMALTAAGFISKLIPGELVGQWLGPGSGRWGILIAAFAGLFVPSGPVVSFSLAAILAQSGAAPPQVVAFITSWCIFAVHRITIYEVPMLGWRFLAIRLLSSFLLPLVAGFMAGGLALAFGDPW